MVLSGLRSDQRYQLPFISWSNRITSGSPSAATAWAYVVR